MPAFLARRYVTGADVECVDGAPVTFVWRGRRHRVRAVLDHWWETAAWWMQQQERPGDDEREMWRVEAVADGRSAVVVELCFAWRSATWTVDAVMD
ncbi:MAG: DUF6504 family protein [Actinomycetes bacterium]